MRWEKNCSNSAGKKKRRLFEYFIYDFVKFTGAPSAWLWVRPKIYYPFGKPNKRGAMIVISNHVTWIDPVVAHFVFPWRRIHSLATKELFSSKLRTFLFTQAHCIMVDKENFNLGSFRQVVERLQEGKLILIFPEGGIHTDTPDQVNAFKSGAVFMAHRAQAPILPMYIAKREKWYHRQRIIVGQPIQVGQLLGRMPNMQQMSQVTELLREKEVELKAYYESLPVYQKYAQSKERECASHE